MESNQRKEHTMSYKESYTVFYNVKDGDMDPEYEVTYPAPFNKCCLTSVQSSREYAIEFLQDKWKQFEEWYTDKKNYERIEEGYYTLDFYATCCSIKRVEYIGFVCPDSYFSDWAKC